jgi:hypothetical protein
VKLPRAERGRVSKLLTRVALCLAAGALLFAVFAAITVWPASVYPAQQPGVLKNLQLTDKERVDNWTARLQLQNTFRVTIVQVLAGVVALSGATVAWRQYLHVVREAQRQRNDKSNDHQLDMFGEALKNFGAATPEVRMGAIYAMARLAELSPNYRAATGDLLSAFVQTNSPWPPEPPRPGEKEWLHESGLSLRSFAPDVQAALMLLGKHTCSWYQTDYLRFRKLDLRRVNLQDGHFENAVFAESVMIAARLKRTNLTGASLRGARLENADLREARLDLANLRSADLTGARFEGVSLQGAIFDGHTMWPTGFSARDALAAGAVEMPVNAPSTPPRRVEVPAV